MYRTSLLGRGLIPHQKCLVHILFEFVFSDDAFFLCGSVTRKDKMYVHFILIVTFSMERLRFMALRLGLDPPDACKR